MEVVASSLFGIVVHPQRCSLQTIKKHHYAYGLGAFLLGLYVGYRTAHKIAAPFTVAYIIYVHTEEHIQSGLERCLSKRHADDVTCAIVHPFLRGIGVMVFCRCLKPVTLPLALQWGYPVYLTGKLHIDT